MYVALAEEDTGYDGTAVATSKGAPLHSACDFDLSLETRTINDPLQTEGLQEDQLLVFMDVGCP